MVARSLRFTCVGVFMITLVQQLEAHPGSGIVVDAAGHVVFVDTGEPGRFRGFIWKVDAQGRPSVVHQRGGHWLALDPAGRFLKTSIGDWFRADMVPIAGSTDAVVQNDGAPMAAGPDGSLYFSSGEDPRRPGQTHITRLSPDGTMTQPFPGLRAMAERLGGITGLAAGRDGTLYVAYPASVQKIAASGAMTTIASQIAIPGCDQPSPGTDRPSLRGLAVDARGMLYAAATGCGLVVRIAPGGKIETVLTSERPWSPTGIAVHGDDVHVLEYAYANGSAAQWLPRVRTLKRDGTIRALVTISPSLRDAARR